jgi:membrane-associated protease RseP (regulator of RpoE activity)
MKSEKFSWDALLVMSVVIVAGVCSQSQQAALAKGEAVEKGRVVQISPDADDAEPLVEEEVVAEPTFWIGIRGRGLQSPVLRTHLQLAEDMGIVVEVVLEESPAEKAGLRKHDIILRANGNAVHGMDVLQAQVNEYGEKPIELELIRLGKEETLVVVPEQRPSRVATVDGDPRRESRGRFGGGGGVRADAMRQLFEQLQQNGGLQGGMRLLDPGALLGEGNQVGQNPMPDGVSLSVTRKNGEPARVTIQRGEDSWEIMEGDQEALQQLPEDLRPLAEGALQQGLGGFGGGMKFNLENGLEDLLPRGFGGFGGGGIIPAPRQKPLQHEDELARRLEQMEKDLRKLQERLLEQEPVIIDELPAQ